MMRLVFLASLVAACGRDVVSTVDPPCAGCTLDLPATWKPVPLLVVLHGNNETADHAAERWRSAALARGWGVLSLQCPRALGCDEQARWYAWGGKTDWVLAQVAAVERQRPLDAARIYLAGWSGGATYIGMNGPRWQKRFAAVVLHGGGQPPLTKIGCPRALPAYFLVGDENPAHGAARRLRDYWKQCGEPVEWDLVGGADHAREDTALDATKATSILEWLERRSRPLVSAR
jgi:poly(3-hydroxybutyrate) depolymerase